ncbi:MAG: LacI family DNA-binding transcriptional regulator [Oscillospiraceae bacterium]
MKEDKRITIKDVASKAGVSVATVSRVMNDADYSISQALRQRVKLAVEELGYVPNELARSLKGNFSRDVGVVLPNITNQFYLQALVGISRVSAQKHYNIILCNTAGSVEEERRCLQELYKKQVKGIIISSIGNESSHIKNLIDLGMHFVLLDQHFDDIDCPSIMFDCKTGAKMAVEHLVSAGHKRIALASMPLTRWSRIQVFEGYRDTMKAFGLGFDERAVFVPEKTLGSESENYELEAGRILGESFLERQDDYTAVLCNNDMVAISFIQTLMKGGVAVPDDVSVMGFDNIPLAEYMLPQLTTVSYPSAETGGLAMTMLHNNIQHNQEFLNLDMSLVPRIIQRESVISI